MKPDAEQEDATTSDAGTPQSDALDTADSADTVQVDLVARDSHENADSCSSAIDRGFGSTGIREILWGQTRSSGAR